MSNLSSSSPFFWAEWICVQSCISETAGHISSYSAWRRPRTWECTFVPKSKKTANFLIFLDIYIFGFHFVTVGHISFTFGLLVPISVLIMALLNPKYFHFNFSNFCLQKILYVIVFQYRCTESAWNLVWWMAVIIL